VPASEEAVFREKLRTLRRWGRWGDNDQAGALNLVTADKVLRAVSLVRLGRVISMSRDFPVAPALNNPNPAEHYLRKRTRGSHGEGSVTDYVGINFHGKAATHIDALCHVWNHDGMWNGRDPVREVTGEGVRWGGIEHFGDGIITRGVLLDVAAHRPAGYVDRGEPVTGAELAKIAAATDLEPGDALVIHSGRDAWDRAHDRPWGSPEPDGSYDLPGLDVSCLDFFYEVDCGLVVWDMMDAVPNDFGVPHATHAAIFSQGIPLLDNAALAGVAALSRELGRSEFMLCVAPLKIVGGTGSPVNPLALF
jgi:kynurenine formamidase